MSGVAEGIQALAWVTMAPKPCPYIKDITGSAQFWTNKVLKEFKGQDENQVNWARAWVSVLTDLEAYVKAHHTTGPAWNPAGGAATAPKPAAAASKKPTAAAAAPAQGSGGDAKASLFAALSSGGSVTAGLKKVDKSQMTHKNPALRGDSVVPAATASGAAKSTPKAAAPAAAKPPVCELQGKKWIVEYQVSCVCLCGTSCIDLCR